ncbi:MAG TPA: PadR family transcriptional regulator [Fimbriimonadaceae bacterium]|jgi:DNA-binding PadR family transcriptional regulator
MEANDLLPLSPVVFAILTALAEGEKHGYAIMKEANLQEGGGITMGAGTLYGSLDRMLKTKLVEETGSTDNERRRYYRITEFGQRVFEAEVNRLKLTLASVSRKNLVQGA